MAAFRAELQKARRRHDLLLCLLLPGIVVLWVGGLSPSSPEELANGYSALLYSIPVIEAILLPVMMAVLAVKNIISINSKLRNQNEGAAGTDIFDPDMSSLKEAFGVKEEQAAKAEPVESAPVQETKGTPEQ